MRKFYEKHWQSIPFSSFSQPDPFHLADAAFYDAFYKKFFERYSDWLDLSPDWLAGKEALAEFILTRQREHTGRVLSIGCGLGAIERALVKGGLMGLEVTETSEASIRWLRKVLPPQNIHIGYFPDCVGQEVRYQFIYLCAVDYCFSQQDWVALLRAARSRLAPGGRCLVLSASLDTLSERRWVSRVDRQLKTAAKLLLHQLGLRSAGQLWGYMRSRREYLQSLTLADFKLIGDGVTSGGTYWIEGHC